MRLVIGFLLTLSAAPAILGRQPILTIALPASLAFCGILLIFGIWTPIVGALIAATELYHAVILRGDVVVSVLIATIACALAMLGPGLWSVDARLFGWKRVEVQPRKIRPASD